MDTPFTIRPYDAADYDQVAALYRRHDLYGGQFDAHRDSPERLRAQTVDRPDTILVAASGTRILATVSLVEDGRVAWLYRFAVDQVPAEAEISAALYAAATGVLAARGHRQVLVYTPVGEERLSGRYDELGMSRGGADTCYWADLAAPVG